MQSSGTVYLLLTFLLLVWSSIGNSFSSSSSFTVVRGSLSRTRNNFESRSKQSMVMSNSHILASNPKPDSNIKQQQHHHSFYNIPNMLTVGRTVAIPAFVLSFVQDYVRRRNIKFFVLSNLLFLESNRICNLCSIFNN
jgi:hypothetical protein